MKDEQRDDEMYSGKFSTTFTNIVVTVCSAKVLRDKMGTLWLCTPAINQFSVKTCLCYQTCFPPRSISLP